jgi:hypothetical protein
MKYICDGPRRQTWFRLENMVEAEQESAAMDHKVAKYFQRAWEQAQASFRPASDRYIEQDIGRAAHVQRTMPLFLTLRDHGGAALVTAMLPPGGQETAGFQIIVVGRSNIDPYPEHGEAIRMLGAHFDLELDRDRCYPYQR